MSKKYESPFEVYEDYLAHANASTNLKEAAIIHARNEKVIYDRLCEHRTNYNEVADYALELVGRAWCEYEGVSPVGSQTLSMYLMMTRTPECAMLYMSVVAAMMSEHRRLLVEVVYPDHFKK